MTTPLSRWRFFVPILFAAALGACASAPSRREVVVDFLTVRGVEGNTTPALVSVEPNKTDRIRVGVLESSALSLSGQWRASVWLAAFQASLALDRPLSDWVVWVEAIRNGAQFDGPSAGALLTAGMLAGMTGQKADPNFTMTGTINPDGTVGPVGGIPQKFKAAIANGKTTLGYPLGQGRATDIVTQQEVELRSLASTTVNVVEVPDVETAYRLLTGKELPQAIPVEPAAMALPPKIEEGLRAQTETWLSNVAGAFGEWKSLNVVDPELDQRWNQIDRLFTETKAFLDSKETAAAYTLANLMFVDADSAFLRGKLTRFVRDGQFEAASQFVGGIFDNIDGRLAGTTAKMKTEAARSASDLMSLTAAYESLGSAVRHFFQGLNQRKVNAARVDELIGGLRQAKLQPLPPVLDELIALLYGPLAEASAANVHNFVADQNLAFRPDLRPDARELPKRLVDRLSQLLRIAGNANISYFEQTTLSEIAKANGVSLETVKAKFGDPAYQLLQDELRAATENAFSTLVGEGTTLEMVRLAEALSAYVDAAFLIAKYYSLDATTAPDGSIIKLGRETVLTRMLELAEVKSRIHAARALKETGEVPVAARLAYQIGRSWQGAPSASARLQALQQYWRASMLSQLAVLLRR